MVSSVALYVIGSLFILGALAGKTVVHDTVLAIGFVIIALGIVIHHLARMRRELKPIEREEAETAKIERMAEYG